jgi:hypothetical protein
MKHINFVALALGTLLVGCATGPKHSAEPGFTPLFDGKTLEGWMLLEKTGPGYVVQDGMLVCPADGGGNLLTVKEYSNFVLRLDFRLAPGANNGIAIRAPNANDNLTYSGNEIQVLDDPAPMYKNILPGQNCGSLYGIFPAKRGAVKPPGEWNHYEITADGRRIQIVLNGQVVVDGNLDNVTNPTTLQTHPGMQRTKGHVGFLGHNAHVDFRNIEIKELTPSAAVEKKT